MSKRNEAAQSAPVITEEQYAAEERLLQGVPRVNIGALFMPPIWGVTLQNPFGRISLSENVMTLLYCIHTAAFPAETV